MRTHLTFLTLIALLCTGIAWAGATADATKAIQAAYDASNAAAARKDVAGTLAVRAPDYVGIDSKGRRLTLPQERQVLTQLLGAVEFLHASSKVVRLSLNGSTATVRVQERLEMRLPNPGTGKISQVVQENTSEDTWIQTDRGWRERESKNLTESTTVDGKPAGGAQE